MEISKQLFDAGAILCPGNTVVVSRHAGAVEWLVQDADFCCLLGRVFDGLASGGIACHKETWNDCERVPFPEAGEIIPVLPGNVTKAEVDGKYIVGNVPLSLASASRGVLAIEFDGAPPRGAEYGKAEMIDAGARLTFYKVSRP